MSWTRPSLGREPGTGAVKNRRDPVALPQDARVAEVVDSSVDARVRAGRSSWQS
jgi:hypothetical protein